jgi:hypothetical protein
MADSGAFGLCEHVYGRLRRQLTGLDAVLSVGVER